MITEHNYDRHLERLIERGRDFGYDSDEGYCLSCSTELTQTSIEAEECLNCGSALVSDESADEGLQDDGYGDY